MSKFTVIFESDHEISSIECAELFKVMAGHTKEKLREMGYPVNDGKTRLTLNYDLDFREPYRFSEKE